MEGEPRNRKETSGYLMPFIFDIIGIKFHHYTCIRIQFNNNRSESYIMV